mgnify:CR=1 FL=1
MEQDFSIIPVKTRKEEYLRRYSFFFEKFPVEKYVPFDLSPAQPVFPYKRKAPLVSCNEVASRPAPSSYIKITKMAGVEHCPTEGSSGSPYYFQLSYFTIYLTKGIEILEYYTKVSASF